MWFIIFAVYCVWFKLWKILGFSSLLRFWKCRTSICYFLFKFCLSLKNLLLSRSQFLKQFVFSSFHFSNLLVIHLSNRLWLFIFKLIKIVLVFIHLMILSHSLVSHSKLIWNDFLLQIVSMLSLKFINLMSDTHSSTERSIHFSFDLKSNSMVFLSFLSNTFLKLLLFHHVLSMLSHKLVHLLLSPSLLCFTLRLLLVS